MIIQPPWEDTAALENTTAQYDNTAPLGGHCCPRKHNDRSKIIIQYRYFLNDTIS